MVYGRGLPPCVKHGTTNDGFISRGAIDDKEIDLLGKLLRYVPMVTDKVMVPMGKTLVPPNLTNGASKGRGRSLLILIYWNVK